MRPLLGRETHSIFQTDTGVWFSVVNNANIHEYFFSSVSCLYNSSFPPSLITRYPPGELIEGISTSHFPSIQFGFDAAKLLKVENLADTDVWFSVVNKLIIHD